MTKNVIGEITEEGIDVSPRVTRVKNKDHATPNFIVPPVQDAKVHYCEPPGWYELDYTPLDPFTMGAPTKYEGAVWQCDIDLFYWVCQPNYLDSALMEWQNWPLETVQNYARSRGITLK